MYVTHISSRIVIYLDDQTEFDDSAIDPENIGSEMPFMYSTFYWLGASAPLVCVLHSMQLW